jgi:hypothetical protein
MLVGGGNWAEGPGTDGDAEIRALSVPKSRHPARSW